MAVNIPDSRWGRALKAGIPVALILLGAELLDGSWRIERNEQGLSLSWTSADEAAGEPAIRVVKCVGGECRDVSLSFSLRAPQVVSDMAAIAGSVAEILCSDRPQEQRPRLISA